MSVDCSQIGAVRLYIHRALAQHISYLISESHSIWCSHSKAMTLTAEVTLDKNPINKLFNDYLLDF